MNRHANLVTRLKRFNRKIEMVPECGCWIWTGASNSLGYGVVQIHHKKIKAHRYSWEINYGPIPAGMEVCHFCDTPACVNPHHLFLGKHKDNMADMVMKKRSAKGEKHSQAKLTEVDVLKIRSDNRPDSIIAKDYDVKREMISNIQRRSSWKHI